MLFERRLEMDQREGWVCTPQHIHSIFLSQQWCFEQAEASEVYKNDEI